MKSHRGILILLVMFLILTALYRDSIGRFEGSDELEHFAYVTHLQHEKSLPDFEADFDSLMRQQVGQAPFFHMTLAAWSSLRSFDWDAEPNRNPWHAYPAPATSTDNRNAFLMNPERNVMTPDQVAMSESLDWMRIFVPVYGVLTILGIYAAALLLWPGQKNWAVFAAMGVAFNPQMIQVFSLVGNDAAVTAFGAWILAVSLAKPGSWRWALLTGILMGLAGLSKSSGLGLWAIPVAAMVLAWRRNDVSARMMTSRLLLMGIVALAVCGWWYARNWIAFDDPLGLGPHRRMEWALDEPASFASITDRLPLIGLSLWANFGSGEIRPGAWGYLIPAAALMLGALGWRRIRIEARHLLMLLPVVIGFLALIQWMREFDLITGRLLFPFYGGLLLLIMSGLRAWGRWLRYLMAGGLAASALLMVPLVIAPAFGVNFRDDLPDDLQGPHIDFGGARFLGYQVDDRSIHTGEDARFTLCWDALPGERPLPMPYAFALHIVGDENRIVGRRESFPGMGTYTLWEAGRVFCDEFALTVVEPLEAGRAYQLSLTLFDPLSGDTPRENTFIGQLRSPAPPVSAAEMESAPFRFEDIFLVDYTLTPADDSLQVELVWGADAEIGADYRLFAHIIDANGDIAAQEDPPPGQYPIELWGAGERITQSLQISLEGLPAGDYSVHIGIYDPATGIRVPARDRTGDPLPDDAAPLGGFPLNG